MSMFAVTCVDKVQRDMGACDFHPFVVSLNHILHFFFGLIFYIDCVHRLPSTFVTGFILFFIPLIVSCHFQTHRRVCARDSPRSPRKRPNFAAMALALLPLPLPLPLSLPLVLPLPLSLPRLRWRRPCPLLPSPSLPNRSSLSLLRNLSLLLPLLPPPRHRHSATTIRSVTTRRLAARQTGGCFVYRRCS